MDRGNIFSGGAFKVTLYSTLILLVLMSVMGFMGFRYIRENGLSAFRERTMPMVQGVIENLDEHGTEVMIERLEVLSKQLERDGRIITLLDKDNQQMFGRYLVPTDLIDWTERIVPFVGPPEDLRKVYITALPIADFTLVTGGEMLEMTRTESVFVKTMIGTAALLTLIFITLGYNMSRLIQFKLEQMDQALAKVADGDTDIRLPVSPLNDQIDRVSRTMNAHLDHLSMLTSATKSNAAAIAHDLKRPLSRSFLSLEKALGELDANQDPRETLEETRNELFELNAIFETILRIARIDSGQVKGKFENSDLAAVVTELAETYEVVAEESGLSLSVDITPNKTFNVSADVGMLNQLIINLLQNAVTHCPEGTRISAGLDRTDSTIRLIIADDGLGISEQDRAKVFDAFFRADKSRSSPGTGLGMAMVKSIADLHRAIITLEDNEPGLRIVITFQALR